jgi:hypothetical protein
MPAVVYGTTVQVLDDLPDPCVLCSELVAAAYACARRWTIPSGAMTDIGETVQYDSFDVRDFLGGRFSLTDKSVLNDIQTQATQVLQDEPFAQVVTVRVTYNAGTLSLTGQIQGANGPFPFVLNVNALTAQLLLPGQS